MRTFKTAVVIVLLMAVLYGVYMVLNKPDALNSLLGKKKKQENSKPLEIERGKPADPNDIISEPQGSTMKGSDLHKHDYTFEDSKRDNYPRNENSPYNSRTKEGYNDQPDYGPSSNSRAKFDRHDPDRLLLDESPQGGALGVTTAAAFGDAWEAAMGQIDERQYRQALETLSVFYNSPGLTVSQHKQLLEVLDPLAAKVIYSTEHLLGTAHVVRRGETLDEIAQKYDVPAQLLKNINGVDNPDVLVPGTELKVMRGPFRGEVDLRGNRLTVFLNGMYAGRFDVEFGNQPPSSGGYKVLGKDYGKVFYPPVGNAIPARDPVNPYGEWWIDLGGNVSIHSSPSSDSADTARLGSISLSPRDAADVWGILSQGSKIEIRR